ncbi:hypothetical protein TWF730_006838 [Orbilia blumenaviensis]|uniref:Uncharacterized protein n=1 Tax=Orbilia blumenaviensis TaxID=1796055 RepID=A0AAV9VFG7_9PEZI
MGVHIHLCCPLLPLPLPPPSSSLSPPTCSLSRSPSPSSISYLSNDPADSIDSDCFPVKMVRSDKNKPTTKKADGEGDSSDGRTPRVRWWSPFRRMRGRGSGSPPRRRLRSPPPPPPATSDSASRAEEDDTDNQSTRSATRSSSSISINSTESTSSNNNNNKQGNDFDGSNTDNNKNSNNNSNNNNDNNDSDGNPTTTTTTTTAAKETPPSPPPPGVPSSPSSSETSQPQQKSQQSQSQSQSQPPSSPSSPPPSPPPPPPPDPQDIYSHSRRRPPRSRSPPPRSLWNIIPVASWRRRARARSRSRHPSKSPARPQFDSFNDPEYLEFDAAKHFRPPPRRVQSVPRASERAARVPTPPSILKNSAPRRTENYPLPAPTEAERNWRTTISQLPSVVADAVLKERTSVEFDIRSRVHGYFDTDPILFTDNTTPERRPSPPLPPSAPGYLDKQGRIVSIAPSSGVVPSSGSDSNNSGTATAKAVEKEGTRASAKSKADLQNYRSLLEGVKHIPEAAPARRRRAYFVPSDPQPENVSPLRTPSAQNTPRATTVNYSIRLTPIKAHQEQTASSGEQSRRGKSRSPNRKSEDDRDRDNGGSENKSQGDT